MYIWIQDQKIYPLSHGIVSKFEQNLNWAVNTT